MASPIRRITPEAMPLPAIIHLSRCPQCEADADYRAEPHVTLPLGLVVHGPCSRCRGVGTITLGVCEIGDELLGFDYNAGKFCSFWSIDEAHEGIVEHRWSFTGSLRDQRICDLLGIEHGLHDSGRARYFVPPRWQDAAGEVGQ